MRTDNSDLQTASAADIRAEQISTLAGKYHSLTPAEKLKLLNFIKADIRAERDRLASELTTLDAALGTIEETAPASSGKLSRSEAAKLRWAKKKAAESNGAASAEGGKKKRVMSAEARARIAAAQKARWAKQKKEGK